MLFYGAFVESVLHSGVIWWFRRATEAQKNTQKNHNHCHQTARHRSERSSRHIAEIFHQSRESFIRSQEPAAGISYLNPVKNRTKQSLNRQSLSP